jgi:LysR family glycine cleavage system transcriptional activator
MADRLPPLTAIRYFEAAARHLSFTKAAEELHVTHSAISHQIKALEEWLGMPLFRRMNRAILLTEAGQAYMRPVKEAFERLGEASRILKAREQTGTLTVSTMPSFAAKWLVPRLGSFREQHPDIDVRISASERLVDFNREDVDVAIRFGNGTWPGLHSSLLLKENLFPVCSPKLLEGPIPLREPADLIHHNLLYDYDWRENVWLRWLTDAGVKVQSLRHSLSFNHSNLMLQAAADGLGVALTGGPLAGDDLAAGRLVRPFETVLRNETVFFLVAPEATVDRPKVKAFREWILAEIERYRKSPEGKLAAMTPA